MPGLSIIIPVLHDVQRLEETLVSVLENRPADCEIIVTHPGTYADPYDLATEVRFVALPAHAPQGECLAKGIEVARGEIVHILAAGAQVPAGWCDAALVSFQNRRVAAVCPLLYCDAKAQRAATSGVAYGPGGRRRVLVHDKHRALPHGPTYQGAYYRRQAVLEAGGWDCGLTCDVADLDLAMKLRRTGYEVAVAANCRITLVGPAKSGAFARGQSLEKLFWRHAGPATWLSALTIHPMGAVFDMPLNPISCLLYWIGRASFWWQRGDDGGPNIQLMREPTDPVDPTGSRSPKADVLPMPQRGRNRRGAKAA